MGFRISWSNHVTETKLLNGHRANAVTAAGAKKLSSVQTKSKAYRASSLIGSGESFLSGIQRPWSEALM
jgi:hypothetical protein